MSGLDAIPIKVDHAATATGNLVPLLYEVRHALARLIEQGEPTVIDLGSLPLSPGELEALRTRLGHGEVEARIDAMGPSEVRESAVPGVWWVTHWNAAEEVMGRYIEVTRLPAILETHPDDLTEGLAALEERIANQA
jgi:hydrogenase-1 operon protein HyaF